MRLYDVMMIDGVGDLASINEEITASVAANQTATPEKPASVTLPYYGGATIDKMPYTGGASVQKLGAAESPTLTNATINQSLDTGNVPGADNYYVRDPKTGLSQAQVDANKAVADAAAASGKDVIKGAAGSSDRVNTGEPDTVTHWRSGITAKKGTALYDTITKQNADRADRDAAYANKPTEDPGLGNRWVWQERNRTWAKVFFGVPGTGGGSTGGGSTGGGDTGGGDTGGNNNAQLQGVIDALNAQIAGLQGQVSDLKAKPTMVGQITRRQTGGIVQVVSLYSDGSEKVIDEYKDYSARDSVMKMFENTGLGQSFLDSLMKSIDQVYADNVAPTDAQILNSIYNSDAYKTRFAANEVIKARMAKGEGRPGDRLLTPAEYVKTEAAYREMMSEAGLPPGFYDQTEDFTKFIAELGTSVAEISERINIAKSALQNADNNIKQALRDYYGLSEQDMVAYLLDPDKAFQAINQRFRYTTTEAREMYTKAEVGGAALRAGMQGGVSEKFAEEITKAGKANLAEEAFQRSARQQEDYQRLLGLYGEQAGTEDLARESLALAGGADIGIKTKKLASKERAKFQQRGAIDRTSLGSRLRTPDV